MRKPSISGSVHYVSYGTPGGEYTSQCRAAIITGTPDCDAQRGGTWHWPESD